MSEQIDTFESISQRVAYTYLRMLAAEPDAADRARHELHVFFQSLYQALFDCPAQFGLPELPDDAINREEPARTKKMSELKRKLQKPRDMIEAGLSFLMQAGAQGRLAGEGGEAALLLDEETYQNILAATRVKKPFLAGLAGVGLEIAGQGAGVALRSRRFPAMFPALKNLAIAVSAAAANPNLSRLARFHFARCDFHALDGINPPAPLDLYRSLAPDQYAWAEHLHEYYTARSYRPIIQVNGIDSWLVQYQGKRSAKSTPLFQIGFFERFRQPLQAQIKCASTQRVWPLMAGQPHFLQQDFFQRVFPSNCDNCGWCRNKPHLGATTIELDGVQKRACWYSNPEIYDFTADTSRLVEQYTLLHEEMGS